MLPGETLAHPETPKPQTPKVLWNSKALQMLSGHGYGRTSITLIPGSRKKNSTRNSFENGISSAQDEYATMGLHMVCLKLSWFKSFIKVEWPYQIKYKVCFKVSHRQYSGLQGPSNWIYTSWLLLTAAGVYCCWQKFLQASYSPFSLAHGSGKAGNEKNRCPILVRRNSSHLYASSPALTHPPGEERKGISVVY